MNILIEETILEHMAENKDGGWGKEYVEYAEEKLMEETQTIISTTPPRFRVIWEDRLLGHTEETPEPVPPEETSEAGNAS